jgi:hypothetical protein
LTTPHDCWFESRQGLWNLPCEEVIQLAYGTSVILLACAQKGTWGLPSPVKLECCHMTYTVLVLCKTQSNKQTNIVDYTNEMNVYVLLRWLVYCLQWKFKVIMFWILPVTCIILIIRYLQFWILIFIATSTIFLDFSFILILSQYCMWFDFREDCLKLA